MSKLRMAIFSLLYITGVCSASDSGTVHVTGNLLTSTCTISGGSDLTFDLDSVTKSDLPDVDSTAGRQEQSIQLSCDADTKINMTVNADSDSSDNTIINNTGTAQGVGLQLLDVTNNSTPIKMGVTWTVISDSTQVETIPIAAQYIRTGNLVAGTVKATATYTLDYE